ncbi:MAG: hypothetical protein DMF69_02875 [Acidobacteria bacterium]|nr:MAG: hypothetical protein DMF69_02875 [Acidobacteriota bacterium]
MRQKFHLSSLSLISGLLLCCALNGFAQNREKYVISAKAGGINAVTGQASMHAKGEADWQQLMITDDLDAGDRVRTAYDGRVEILLNPGSYLRLGGNSEVELSNNSLANLEVRLIRGTAIVEATGVEETQLLINISTPHARMAIDRQGLYRLNVVPNDATELIVRKGRVILGDTNTKIKGGNKVVFSATVVSVAKLTDQDKKFEKTIPVEAWSKDRAETLAKANRRINNRMLTSAFSSFSENDFFSGFRRSGFWFYNSQSSCYTFLPFGYTNSPYGNRYPTTIYSGYGYSGAGNYPVAGGSNGNYPGGNGGTASGGNGGSYSPSSAPVRTMPTMPAPSAPAPSMAAPRDVDSGQRVRATPERP